jgi:hypothetical protein
MSLHTDTIKVMAAALALFAAEVSAETIYQDSFELCRVPDVVEWDGGGDGKSWWDPLNWQGDQVPVDGDAVAIREPDSLTVEYGGLTTTLSCLGSTANLTMINGTLVLDGPATVTANFTIQNGRTTVNKRLVVNGDLDLRLGTLDGAGTVTVYGPFTWSGGSQAGLGETIADGGLLINGANGKNLSERTLTLNDASSWTGSGDLTLRWGATINVNASFDIATDADMSHIQGGNPFMKINGSLTKSSGTGLTIIGSEFSNTGSIAVNTGQLSFIPGGIPAPRNSSGEFTVESGSTLAVRANHTFEASSSFSGAGGYVQEGGVAVMQGNFALTGPLEVSGGTLQFPASPVLAGDVTISGGDLELPSGASVGGDVILNSGELLVSGPVTIAGALQQAPTGTLNGTAAVIVNGLFTWTGGSQRGLGETIANGGTEISGANTKDLRERTLTLNGATSWTGSGPLTLRFGPVINVNAPFDIATNANMDAVQGAWGIMNLSDSLIKSAGAGETQIHLNIKNSGSIRVDSGQLNFPISYNQDTLGALDVTIAGNADFDVYPVGQAATLDGTLNINLSGGYEPVPGDTFQIMTAASVTGTFATVNGTAIVAGRNFKVVYGAKDVTLEVVEE